MADQTSDDPLSEIIYMITDNSSADDQEEKYSVSAYNTRTGVSYYIGMPGTVES